MGTNRRQFIHVRIKPGFHLVVAITTISEWSMLSLHSDNLICTEPTKDKIHPDYFTSIENSEFGNQQWRRQKTKLLILLYLSQNVHYGTFKSTYLSFKQP